jgi:hypothetical protein
VSAARGDRIQMIRFWAARLRTPFGAFTCHQGGLPLRDH